MHFLSLILLGLCPIFFSEVSAHTTPIYNLNAIPASKLPQMEVEDGDQGVWEAGSKTGLRQALKLQLELCENQKIKIDWNFAGKIVPRSQYCNETLNWFLTKLDQVKNLNELYERAKQDLDWYQSVGRPETKDVLFTGYYFPTYSAKRKKEGEFQWPVYAKPNDLVQVWEEGRFVWRRKVGKVYVPYYTREEIEAGSIQDKNAVIAYLNHPVDAYMLQVEGSGALMLQNEDHSETKLIVNYTAANGHDYTSLGKVMRANGIPESYINEQGIKRYFTEHPEKWKSLANQNKSYVFFAEANTGPYGAENVILTPKHSLAIDHAEFPLGVMALIQAERAAEIKGDLVTVWKPFLQFALTQDIGGAIKSPGRVDIYWGETAYAEITAGQLNKTGSLYFALVRHVSGKKH